MDLYAALELAKGASGGAIKKAYRALALRWHPDKNAGDAEAHARFQDISKAYAVLSDPTKRAYYDQTGDVEDIDVSADDFVRTFVVMMDDLLGGGTIEDMLDGLGDADFASMPPFPFPKHLFPPGTFPENMRFSEAFPVPPAVAELVEREGPEALQRLVSEHKAKTNARRGGDDDDSDSSRSSEWESDDDLVFARASDRDRGAGTRGGGGRGVAVSGDARPKTSTPRSSTTKTSATPSSRRCCARCLPRCSSSSCARTRAPAARRARRLPRSWRFWRRWGCRSRGCRPSSPGSWGARAAAAAAAGDSARLEARAAPAPVRRAPARGRGRGRRGRAARAHSARGPERVPPREKGWVSRDPAGGVGPRGRDSRPRDARGRFGRFFFFFAAPKGFRAPPGLHAGVAHGEEQAQEGAQEDEREGEGHGEGRVGS